MNVAILQRATGPAASLLLMVERHHRRCAETHEYGYFQHLESLPVGPYWYKIYDLLTWLGWASEGDIAVWLDADALWTLGTFPLASALEAGFDLGMVKMWTDYFNTGVMFVRASPRMKRFFERVLEGAYPGRKNIQLGTGMGYHDQAYVNYELMQDEWVGLKVQAMDSRFNSFRYQKHLPTDKIVVQSWHQEPFACASRNLATALLSRPAGTI